MHALGINIDPITVNDNKFRVSTLFTTADIVIKEENEIYLFVSTNYGAIYHTKISNDQVALPEETVADEGENFNDFIKVC